MTFSSSLLYPGDNYSQIFDEITVFKWVSLLGLKLYLSSELQRWIANVGILQRALWELYKVEFPFPSLSV